MSDWNDNDWVRELPALVSIPFLARRLGIAKQRIYELAGCGAIESVRVGRRGIRLKRESVVRWLGGREE